MNMVIFGAMGSGKTYIAISLQEKRGLKNVKRYVYRGEHRGVITEGGSETRVSGEEILEALRNEKLEVVIECTHRQRKELFNCLPFHALYMIDRIIELHAVQGVIRKALEEGNYSSVSEEAKCCPLTT